MRVYLIARTSRLFIMNGCPFYNTANQNGSNDIFEVLREVARQGLDNTDYKSLYEKASQL